MLYTCIIPCYNSEKSISEVINMIECYFRQSTLGDFEVILVNDHSKDQTVNEIRKLVNQYSNITGIDLAKNSGQHNALLAGMSIAKGDFIISLDDDLQTDPSQIGKMVEKLNEGYDVVYGTYHKMKQSPFRNLGRSFNHYTVRKLIGKPKELEASSFWIIKRFVRDEIIKSKSNFTNLQGLFLRTTDKIGNVEIEHHSRAYGKSNYTLRKLIRLWASCLNYSYIPFHICLSIGLIGSMIALFFYLIMLILAVLLISIDYKYFILLNSLLFLVSIIILCMGMIGEYIGRLFMVITNDPQYVVKEIIQNDLIKKIGD